MSDFVHLDNIRLCIFRQQNLAHHINIHLDIVDNLKHPCGELSVDLNIEQDFLIHMSNLEWVILDNLYNFMNNFFYEMNEPNP